MSRSCGLFAFFKYGVSAMAVVLGVLYWMDRSERLPFGSVVSEQHWEKTPDNPDLPLTSIEVHSMVPENLLGTLYQPTDFENELGIVPPFWTFDNNNNTTNATDHNYTLSDPPSWGPCYVPESKINWDKEIQDAQTLETNKYARAEKIGNSKAGRHHPNDVRGGCRPGFLIIGAGKCGTSSLYHYLTGHPRVLPAIEKQIHYFKYHAEKPLSWYYSFFPTTANFLASGALMTGEASPGYLPYPNVARLVQQRLPGPKIVMVGREPIDRSYSSYRYNYVTPTIEAMQKGKVKGTQGGQPDEYYHQFLFSFEEMVRAELDLLKECLALSSSPGGDDDGDGYGAVKTRNRWKGKKWAREEFERRQNMTLPPLIDMDEICYGKRVSGSVLRRQWTTLQTENPSKVIMDHNTHLVQSIIGRSLYLYPLEWWYLHFDAKDIFFVCTEELNDLTGAPLNELGMHLGLESYNFSSVVAEGAYNVGGHRGYDKATSWAEVEEEEHHHSQEENDDDEKEIPLSEELKEELQDFLDPINERLFQLTGRRCNW